jgi:hypothetical protein
MANTSLGVTGARIVEKNINVLVGNHEDPGLQAVDHCAEQAQCLVHCRMSQCPERNEETNARILSNTESPWNSKGKDSIQSTRR